MDFFEISCLISLIGLLRLNEDCLPNVEDEKIILLCMPFEGLFGAAMDTLVKDVIGGVGGG